MRSFRFTVTAIALMASIITTRPASASWFKAGRYLEHGRNFSMRFSIGSIQEVEVLVEETTRRLYDVTGSYWKQDDAESYSLNDLGLEGPFPTVGISIEKGWKYITLQFDTMILEAETDSVARRNYYISIGKEIEYEGKKYDHMRIPKYTPFTLSMVGGTVEIRTLLTLFTLAPCEMFRITPSLDLGLFGFVGQYEVDAGPVQGTYTYQDPPVDFVVGGKSSGLMGLGMPEVGGSLEVRLGGPDTANLVFQGHYGMMAYDGSTKYLTSSEHREKNVDFEHENIRGRIMLEIPLKNSRCVSFGIQYQVVDTEAFISSTATEAEEILEKQERFDKNAEFHLEALQAMIGYTF